VVGNFAAIAFLPLIATTGIWDRQIWLMPWLFIHFWLSTFTPAHYTTQRSPFLYTWDGMLLQLNYLVLSTVSTRWIEFSKPRYHRVYILHHLQIGHSSIIYDQSSSLQIALTDFISAESLLSWSLRLQISVIIRSRDLNSLFQGVSPGWKISVLNFSTERNAIVNGKNRRDRIFFI